MNCDLIKERMIEVLYDEDISPADSDGFFRHLEGCEVCRSDFLGLTQTKRWLGSWKIESSDSKPVNQFSISKAKWWWPTVLRLAASVLIVVGCVSILRESGLWGDNLSISERQWMELVTDIVVSQQIEQENLIGRALRTVTDEVSLQQVVYSEDLTLRLQALEISIQEASQERDKILRMLVQ